jgi:hypothetical protein
LAKSAIFVILTQVDLRQGERLSHGDVMVPLLRFIAVAFLASSAAVPFGVRAVAEPLDKDACANLQVEQKKLLTPAMLAALERGPDWVKDHLNDQEIERVRDFLEVEEMIKFRCRTGVPKPKPPAPPPGPVSAEGVPLPDRNPNREATAAVDTKPSQTVADSDKTPPSQSKATR